MTIEWEQHPDLRKHRPKRIVQVARAVPMSLRSGLRMTAPRPCACHCRCRWGVRADLPYRLCRQCRAGSHRRAA